MMFFLFFKNYFWHQHIKTIQNIQIILNFSREKFKFFENAAAAAFLNIPLIKKKKRKGCIIIVPMEYAATGSDEVSLLVVVLLSILLKWTQRAKESVFSSVVAGAFQIAFRAEMHANDVFLFFKNYFWHQHIKTIQKVQTTLNFSKKKNSNLKETQVQTQ